MDFAQSHVDGTAQYLNRKAMLLLILLSTVYSYQLLTMHPAQDVDVILMSGDNPPFSYTNEQNQIVGISVDKVTSIVNKAGLSYQIQIAPWLRAMEELKKHENMLLYPLSRIPEREKNFKWLHAIHTIHFKLYGLEGTTSDKTANINDENNKFVCLDKSVTCAVIEGYGIKENNIIRVTQLELPQMVRMLLNHRISYLVIADAQLEMIEKLMADEKKSLVTINNSSVEIKEYIASGFDIDESVVEKLNKVISQQE